MEHYETENSMKFNMQEVGARIASLRREADLTQAELAEKLGISYQAVSSWERGASMPDIGKLMDLARALNVTVDALLGGEKVPVPEEINEEVTQLDPDVAENAEWAMEHAEDEQPKKKKIDMQMLLSLAPFLPSEELEKLALEACDEANFGMLVGLAPFMHTSALERLLDYCEGEISPGQMMGVIPFVSQSYLGKLLDKCDIRQDAGVIQSLAPFLSRAQLMNLINRLREE